MNPLNYHVWDSMLEKYHKLQPKPETIDELKVALQTIWKKVPQGHINKAVAHFTRHLTVCAAANGSHFEHLQSVHLQVCIIISAPKNWLFSEPPTYYRRKQRSKC